MYSTMAGCDGGIIVNADVGLPRKLEAMGLPPVGIFTLFVGLTVGLLDGLGLFNVKLEAIGLPPVGGFTLFVGLTVGLLDGLGLFKVTIVAFVCTVGEFNIGIGMGGGVGNLVGHFVGSLETGTLCCISTIEPTGLGVTGGAVGCLEGMLVTGLEVGLSVRGWRLGIGVG